MLGSTLAHRQLLRSSPFFSRLGDSEADAVLAQATVARYATGALIFAKGDHGNSMMAVLRGRVMISSPSVDGSPHCERVWLKRQLDPLIA